MTFVARIYVTPRQDVLDPQGKAVGHALHSLGFDEVADVSIGRYLVVKLDSADWESASARLDRMCETLLANTVVEDFRYELEEQG